MKALKKPFSIPRDVRIPLLLGLITLALTLVRFGYGVLSALVSGAYGLIIGLISLPMKRWRRMFACFGLCIFCFLIVWSMLVWAHTVFFFSPHILNS